MNESKEINSTRLGINLKDAPTTVSARLTGDTLRAFQTIAHLSNAKYSRVLEFCIDIAIGVMDLEVCVIDLILSRLELQSLFLTLAKSQHQEHGFRLIGIESAVELKEVTNIDIHGVKFQQDRLHFWGDFTAHFHAFAQSEEDVTTTETYKAWLSIDRVLSVELEFMNGDFVHQLEHEASLTKPLNEQVQETEAPFIASE